MTLQARGLEAGYGRAAILSSIDLTLEPGGIVAVIGSNGAGKSTLARTLAGLLRLKQGEIEADGVLVQDHSAERRARSGLILVPEGRRLFGRQTVAENIRIGGRAASRRSPERARQNVEMLLDSFPVLRERWNQKAGLLSGGEQQMVALTRAVASEPRYLLLDEPSLGLSPRLTQEVFRLVTLIARETGAGILLIEQMAEQALQIADFAYVLEQGRITAEGPSSEVGSSEAVRTAYLGK
ncbi:ABC transporter ATP-binding protein [Nocardioides acrostichi]|uniref:ABC transporter ATP-binding protein n=1 Tax=Nocardioides acrostichi TaxID=2784339 RepID=A0A930YBT7_9ACTN|nr:ABC transporter ATP-binding protein [Nocardioides acrostichi]MBF4160794.1 ABC transporter ATP-binding protein [Nocardioides acrostichi]